MAKRAVFGLAGWSGSGKTTLAEKLINVLSERGLTIATIKHAHHKFDADIPGKDSWRHRKAGADQVLVSSAMRSAHFIEHAREEPSLEMLLAKLDPCDIVLVEGFKKEAIPKLEIYRGKRELSPLYPEDPHIIALISDAPPENCPLPILASANIDIIADFIMRHLEL
jgi:molybdopterin-guanine dinucleotide biosynthesis protein B